MTKTNNKKLLTMFAILLIATINFVAWLWVIDWAIWYDTPWIYVPLVAWNVEISKGEAINMGYWMLCISLVVLSVASLWTGMLIEAYRYMKEQ